MEASLLVGAWSTGATFTNICISHGVSGFVYEQAYLAAHPWAWSNGAEMGTGA